MILFPIPGLPLPQSPREFRSFDEAHALASVLGNVDFLTVLKAALLMAGQKDLLEQTADEKLVLESARQNKALAFLTGIPPLSFKETRLEREFAKIHSPVTVYPDSLDGQIGYVAKNWIHISPDIREKIITLLGYAPPLSHAAAGPGSSEAPAPPPLHGGEKNYSRDAAWMQNLVVVAKNVPLWLAQLSREHRRDIRRLDEIPESELAFLGDCGVNGIWLVGLWQRSEASATIKRKSGNKEAESSAYAVFDYAVDGAYGGESALRALRGKAGRCGIRLGCDMVPNHTGIDSRWLREHADWFMQTPVKPFPAYTFSGENLSAAGNETRIEDHYYTHSDAAVVFEHRANGNVRYIYHGNDGTGLPWNDTAQLNHLLPEVRKALIETALTLAQQFDFIRFDAAMTLLKEHYRRLWFPAPGTQPAIASRSAFAMSDAEFDAAMPEFWRELVVAFAAKSPGTLLMAEAFWLTENYFIGTVGMHRVYNSAFMHFLAAEKNADFSAFMTDHLKTAETLQRFANYLSTPDEKPAGDFFGFEDKYFGAMTLMATLPGLPLLAPGQLEGFSEKYAMDQKIPRLTEDKNADFIARHQREISPLLRQRSEFADPQYLRWLRPRPEAAAQQVIAYETGKTRKIRMFFNNSPAPVQFTCEQSQFSLGPYESLIQTDIVADRPARPTPAAQAVADKFPALNRYHSGVTIPVGALVTKHSCGIGEFADLKMLADWCAETGQNFIALLPVSDTGSNPSPYSALSAFALHPVYLRLEAMPGFDVVRAEEAEIRHASQTGKKFRFDEIRQLKTELLRKIYNSEAEKFFGAIPETYSSQAWLIDYAIYKNIKSRLGEAPAYAWADYPSKPADIAALLADNTAAKRREFFAAHFADTGFYVWLQYHAELQLLSAVEYAREKGVYIKGDLPILLERDSVDVWLNPQLFRSELKAGAPPDHYAAEGQNWGFPVYDWPAHRADGFAWWKSRISRAGKFFAAYRIDHVLGFFRIWSIDATETSGYCGFFLPSSSMAETELTAFLPQDKITALSDPENRERPLIRNGKAYYPAWDFDRKLEQAALSPEERGQLRQRIREKTSGDDDIQRRQGHEILSALKSASGMLACAEDLGVVPDYIGPTLAELKILSLCVLRWRDRNGQLESPRDYTYFSVATPSVHDSTNLREWLLNEGARFYAGEQALEKVLEDIYDSASALVLVPIQDLLALDPALHGPPEKERINVPGTVSEKNWHYRMPLALEDLLLRTGLNDRIRRLVAARSARRPPFT